MKKLKLQTLGLSVNDLLSKEQLKKVMGGSGSGGSGGSSQSCTITKTSLTSNVNELRSGGSGGSSQSCTITTRRNADGAMVQSQTRTYDSSQWSCSSQSSDTRTAANAQQTSYGSGYNTHYDCACDN